MAFMVNMYFICCNHGWTVVVCIRSDLPDCRRDYMNSVKVWTMRGLTALVPAIALAMPAFAQVRDPKLADLTEPGSVIIYPKFATGAVPVDGGPPAPGYNAPKTLIELSIQCPTNAVPCFEPTPVRVHFHWVCPPVAPSNVCLESDFDVTATVGFDGGEKITFNPGDGTTNIPNPAGFGTINGNTVAGNLPPLGCTRGYLIGWVVNFRDQPIKFDALTGDVIQRNNGADLQSEQAFTIQADPALANAAAITTTAAGGLIFDGNPGHYLAVTGQISGDVRYDDGGTNPPGDGFLILFTLDVRSSLPNAATVVGLDFFNETSEQPRSTSTSFTCWEQVQLSTGISPVLTVPNMGSIKGQVISGQAFNQLTGDLVTLLGFFQQVEGPAGAARSYTTRFNNNSVVVPTTFIPLP